MRAAAVTLDAGGTLVEVVEPVGTTYARIAGRFGIALDPAVAGDRFRAAFSLAPPLAFPGASPTRLPEHERAWWYAVVRHAFGPAASHPAFDACFDALFAHYAAATAWRLFPEVPGALATLRAHGVRLAVVSNFDRRLVGLLADLGLASAVDRIVYSSGVGAAKPDARPFTEALRRLGAAAADTLHVGDDLRSDVEGAAAAGLRPVLLDRRRRGPVPGVTTIATLAELPALALQP
jgi:putative hydrolase of the HAD superfamily